MKKTKLPSLVTVLILTLITVVFWVIFDVYRLFIKTETPVVPESVSQPLDPRFDQATIDQIKNRIFLDDSQIPEVVVNAPIEQSENPTPEPESDNETSETESPTPEPSSSPSPNTNGTSLP